MISRTLKLLPVLLAATALAHADNPAPAGHLVWEVPGATNRVFLLGSIHMLRASDYPLPPAYDAVYATADKLVMELDMDDLDLVRLQQVMVAAGMVQNGRTLRDLLGAERWSKATSIADSIDVQLDMLMATEPWFAALTVVELQMMKLDFDPQLGVEYHFVGRAREDGKPIEGLETVEEQIAFFDGLPLDTQARFLLKTLADVRELETGIETLMTAWRTGDTTALERELTRGFEGFPGVYDALVTRRNRAWLDRIETLLGEPDDYLVIVGALHLVGPDSVIRLLEKRGFRPARH